MEGGGRFSSCGPCNNPALYVRIGTLVSGGLLIGSAVFRIIRIVGSLENPPFLVLLIWLAVFGVLLILAEFEWPECMASQFGYVAEPAQATCLTTVPCTMLRLLATATISSQDGPSTAAVEGVPGQVRAGTHSDARSSCFHCFARLPACLVPSVFHFFWRSPMFHPRSLSFLMGTKGRGFFTFFAGTLALSMGFSESSDPSGIMLIVAGIIACGVSMLLFFCGPQLSSGGGDVEAPTVRGGGGGVGGGGPSGGGIFGGRKSPAAANPDIAI